MDSCYRTQKLSHRQINMAKEFLREEHEFCLLTVFDFRTQTRPFEQYMFMPGVLEKCLCLLGGSLKSTNSQDVQHLAYQMPTVVHS